MSGSVCSISLPNYPIHYAVLKLMILYISMHMAILWTMSYTSTHIVLYRNTGSVIRFSVTVGDVRERQRGLLEGGGVILYDRIRTVKLYIHH